VPPVGRLSAPSGVVNRDMVVQVASSLRRPVAWLLVLAATGAAVAVALTSRHVGQPAAEAAFEAEGIIGMSLAAAWWLRRRPAGQLGYCLAGLAALTAGASLESSDEPAIYAVGVMCSAMLLVAGAYCLLAFPSGHLRGRGRRGVVAFAAATLVLASVPAALVSPSIEASGPLDACSASCPENALQVATVSPGVVDALRWAEGIGASIAALGLAVVLVRRFALGTPPNRRAVAWIVAVGAPAGVVFSARWLVSAAFPGADGLAEWLTWTYAILLALLPLAFVVPLVRAQVGAGSALEDMLRQLARRPDLGRWEQDVAAALGDPGLRLAVWSSPEQAYLGTDGRAIVDPAELLLWHRIDRGGAPIAAIVHDPALEADPELLHAAGTATLLSLESRHLEDEMRAARFRILAGVEAERRSLERDLHDGAQQHLIALRVKVALMAESDPDDAERVLAELAEDVDATLDEVRALAQGIYPPLLQAEGLTGALRAAARRSPIPASVHCTGARYPVEVESAIYFCCLEALQNAGKHTDPSARATVRVSSSDGVLRFKVEDTGQGFDVRAARAGMGIANMTERMAAIGGDIRIVSHPQQGTVVSGWATMEELPPTR
jgi:signal transduction histidine kinase